MTAAAPAAPPLTLAARALRIARERLAQAIELPDGSLTWHPGYGVTFAPVDDSGMFNGRVGDAFFLAAVHAATGRAEMRDAALRATAPLRARIRAAGGPEGLLAETGYGLTGTGSMVYALVRMAGFLGEPAMLDEARTLAAVFTPDAIARDEKLEMFWGTAGTIPALFALADADPAGAAGWTERAVWCAGHLAAHRQADPETGLRAWPGARGELETGFAHGSSGVAHALLEVFRRTGERRFYDAAVESFAFERALFREDVMDWPDSRSEPGKMIGSWCHGAPGIGLSRLAALDGLRPDDERGVAGDLFLALEKAGKRKKGGVDNLCCGHFGRVDFLLETARRLGNPSLEAQARALAEQRLRATDQRGFRLPEHDTGGDEHMRTGLWQGAPGIGYALLRLDDPARFPCILLLA
ncbi:MAG TPA: lanthionine synthetase LanC family protein [Longimicrobium sp.]